MCKVYDSSVVILNVVILFSSQLTGIKLWYIGSLEGLRYMYVLDIIVYGGSLPVRRQVTICLATAAGQFIGLYLAFDVCYFWLWG